MRQSWLHTNRIQNGSPARIGMRFSEGSLCVGLCADFADSNYEPKLTTGNDARVKQI